MQSDAKFKTSGVCLGVKYVRMATVDSGNETLFSDDSPCELVGSPNALSGDDSEVIECHQHMPNRPPNIQPFSGVLEKGRVVIRPIAFRPSGMSPAGRFGLDGERYGSTPILTRTDADHRHLIPNSNYSLDRKLRSSCQSVTSSPPLSMTTFSSLPQKIMTYDSLESVRKSPVSTADSTLTNKSSYRLSGVGGSLLDLTPSPSDSGVSELEAALRDRDSELAYLRQTMEHNEQVIFRVYQEKERVWERELRRLKTLHENRLRTIAQKALKLEQMLMMQTYQLQQDKKRLSGDAQKANYESDRLRQEVAMLRERLEETEWNLCQKTGEISLLKSQLKDYQNDQTSKGHELLQLRNENKDVREQFDISKVESATLRRALTAKDVQISTLKQEIQKLENYSKIELKTTDNETDSKYDNDQLKKDAERIYCLVKTKEEEAQELINMLSLKSNGNNCVQVNKLKEQMEIRRQDFEKERFIWAQEKEKVLKYQRQLQINYIQMYRRSKALESEVESLTAELDLKKSTKNKLSTVEITHTIEL
ncbi:hypothetical protein RN001_006059 [Aquatica leii]|uniref:Uncharacterized protein n=1 Tax=Aquatica leii TaxID=1421715 RepID=A0AAN7Q8J1_9COLE|nr:hypothetical protein RN001_006059 [Aquatica leii]